MPNIHWKYLLITVVASAVVWHLVDYYWKREIENKDLLP